MSRWTAEGELKATYLVEAAAWHQAIKPICQCGHSATFNPHGLWWHFEKRGWNDQLSEVRRRFWCTMCRSRSRHKVIPVRIELVRANAADIELPWPPEDVWKRQARRMR